MRRFGEEDNYIRMKTIFYINARNIFLINTHKITINISPGLQGLATEEYAELMLLTAQATAPLQVLGH